MAMAFQYEFKSDQIIQEGRVNRENINHLKNWLKKPEIPEEFIVLCLISCENNLENTKRTIQAYFKYKAESIEIFTGRDIDSEELSKAAEVTRYVSISERIPPNTVIHFFNIKDTNHRNFIWSSAMKLAFMLVDISTRINPPDDLVVVIDMKGIGFMHLTHIKLHQVRVFLAYLQEAMPLKIKKIHILNANYILDKLIALARVFIKNELMSMIKSYPPGADMETFYENEIPKSCLPKDYGGDLPTTEELNQETIKKFRNLKEYFKAEEKLIN